MLQIAVEKVCDVIIKALALNSSYEEEGGDDFVDLPVIDDEMEFSEKEDDRYIELRRVINKFNIEEKQDLVALAWIGRGSFGADEWEDALAEVDNINPEHIADYLINMGQLGDYLEEGLSELGYSSEEFETGIR
ncbi:DUF3775 domain-containing protein [Sneathiella limimaris]|uniref:DUF3775 domain-containing protein n=1 Tax=Sneathiella limimaris TaxID=1964213 RepID=UPI00146D7B28|nr:DUF3775 domain-containing protein [Sneathiella limimaris]